MNINKATLINDVAHATGSAKPAVETLVNALFDYITGEMAKGNTVTLAGFGTFSPRERHARMGVNPLNPKEKIHMPATIVPKFKAGKTLKDALKMTAQQPAAPIAEPEEPAAQ